MFDFTPVGLAAAAAGVAFVATIGWRLVPARSPAGIEGFESGAYLTEARVQEGGASVGKTLGEMEQKIGDSDAQIVGLVRNATRIVAPNPRRKLRAGDILVVEAEAQALAGVLSTLGLMLEEAVEPGRGEAAHAEGEPDAAGGASVTRAGESRDALAGQATSGGDGYQPGRASGDSASAAGDDQGEDGGQGEREPASAEVALMELAVLPGSALSGRSASDLLLRTRYGLNLLALSRHGRRSTTRLRSTPLAAGDLLLMQGSPEAVAQFASDNGCVPLAEREVRIHSRRRAWTAGIVMAIAVGGAAFGLLPAAISFALGVLASMALRTVPPGEVYEAIDWPVIVLLAALIPVAGAMEATGTAGLIARVLLEHVARGQAVGALVLILVVTMFLSDLMNNAATAAVMCPIAIGTAAALGVSADSFLMAVAIGASCAFLTPIGHQNNTLILGPGGLRFGDYWRVGLPLEVMVAAVSVPLLLVVWPL